MAMNAVGVKRLLVSLQVILKVYKNASHCQHRLTGCKFGGYQGETYTNSVTKRKTK